MSENGNFQCYEAHLGSCPEEGDSTIYNTVMSAVHELVALDREAKSLADRDWFSKEGKLERLAPLQKKAADEAARQMTRIAGYGADLIAAEDRLLLPPALAHDDAVGAHDDGERRKWFDNLNDNERSAIVAEMRNGSHEDIMMALARSPTPGKGRGVGREIWRARVEQKRGSEVRALAARRRALAWAESALQAVNKYAATNPWSNKPAETAIDKMNRGRAGRPSQPSA